MGVKKETILSKKQVKDAECLKVPAHYEKHALQKNGLYRLPWSKNDNPVGWVEITDVCNLKCLGCYRHNGVDGHKSLEEIEEEILFLQKWRNITNVHLAGGEPLAHPQIVQIIDIIRTLGLNPLVITNGALLEAKLLAELKKAGLVEMSFHIDSGQNRSGWEGKNELELCELRQRYVDMLREAGGVNCNFNMTVSKDNFAYVPGVVQWILDNRGAVSGLTMIPLRGMIQDDVEYVVGDRIIIPDSSKVGGVADIDPENFKLMSTDIYSIIKTHFPAFETSSYLGGTMSHDSFKWLVSRIICRDNTIAGAIGPKTMEIVQAMYHLVKGTYFSGGKGKTGRSLFLLAPFDRTLRKCLRSLLRRPWQFFGNLYQLSIIIVQPPDMLENGAYDMCDGCPDITYYKGELVHSCRLEEFRLYGQYAAVKKKIKN